jgi:hypothetical protein
MSKRFADESSDVQVKRSRASLFNDSTEFEYDAVTSVEPEDVAKDQGTRSEVMEDDHPTIKSLLLEDGVDVSEQPVSQLCELCWKILRYINDETKVWSGRKRKGTDISNTRIQHHENDSDLKRSAANGCGLCFQFVQGLQDPRDGLWASLPLGTVSCSWFEGTTSWLLELLATTKQITSYVTISHALAPGNLRTSPSTLEIGRYD